MANGSGRIQIGLAVISGLAAIISAGIAGWVTFSTQRMQTELIDTQGRYNQQLERLRTANQAAIARLQEETKRSIAESEAVLNKAGVFAKLVDDLSEPRKAGFALLALWQLNPDQKGRNLIIAAALSTPDGAGVRALKSLALVEDVGDSVKEILAKAEQQGNTVLAKSAQEVIGTISVEDATSFTLDQVLNLEPYKTRPGNGFVSKLIEIASANAEARARVASAIADNPGKASILNYVLYAAGEGARLDPLLAAAEQNPDLFPKIAEIVRFGKFQNEDQVRVLTLTVAFLDSAGDDYEQYKAIWALRLQNWGQLPDGLRGRAISHLRRYAKMGDYEHGRSLSIEILVAADPKKALDVISELLANAESNGFVLAQIEEALEGGPSIHKPLRTQFDTVDLPRTNAGATVWQQWRQTNAASLTP